MTSHLHLVSGLRFLILSAAKAWGSQYRSAFLGGSWGAMTLRNGKHATMVFDDWRIWVSCSASHAWSGPAMAGEIDTSGAWACILLSAWTGRGLGWVGYWVDAIMASRSGLVSISGDNQRRRWF